MGEDKYTAYYVVFIGLYSILFSIEGMAANSLLYVTHLQKTQDGSLQSIVQ
jgi:hypothetical protein